MKISLYTESQHIKLSFRGDFDESLETHLKPLFSKLEHTTILMNVEKVELINSMGARQWISFVTQLQNQKKNLTFECCSPTFVEACNLYPKFTNRGQVKSFLVPIECQCGNQFLELKKSEDRDQLPALKVTCPKCKAMASPSVDFDDYLQFLGG